jgi:chemotaxis-related protein WspB
MVYLLFQIGADRYALEASRVAAVEPRVRLKRIPGAAAGVAGVFDYHGTAVPVVDLSAMALGRPAQENLSTRIVVAHYEEGKLLGLLAEKAVDTARFEAADFQDPGVTGAPYLGPVAAGARGGMIQRVELARLLTPEVREALWLRAREVPL